MCVRVRACVREYVRACDAEYALAGACVWVRVHRSSRRVSSTCEPVRSASGARRCRKVVGRCRKVAEGAGRWKEVGGR